MSFYTLSTWMFAVLLYPVIFFFYIGGGYPFSMDMIGIYIILTFFNLIFSLPSLFLSMVTTSKIANLAITHIQKFVLWLVAAMVIVVINFYAIFLLFIREKDLTWDFFNLIIPAMIAVAIIIVLQQRSFFNAVEKLNPAKQSTELDIRSENELR